MSDDLDYWRHRLIGVVRTRRNDLFWSNVHETMQDVKASARGAWNQMVTDFAPVAELFRAVFRQRS